MPHAARDTIRFLLGAERVELKAVDPTLTLLDWLRIERRLVGSKEGCAEGDCGACTVVVGRLVEGRLVYEPVNACITFVSTLDARHVLTIEHLRGADGGPHAIQTALVEAHATQCGFCTPGFAMSLYALWMNDDAPDETTIEAALQGNLCRCTGYKPIVEAGLKMGSISAVDRAAFVWRKAEAEAALAAMADPRDVAYAAGERLFVAPATSEGLARALAAHPGATLVSGATDVGLWVTKQMKRPQAVFSLARLDDLRFIEETPEGLRIGAMTTYRAALPVLAKLFPSLGELIWRIGGEQVRAMGTIGGNIANGSPIGDTPPPLIALGARLRLRSARGLRELPLEAFFLDYGKQDRAADEFVESVFVPKLEANDVFRVWKITKRFDEDISAVCAAFRLRLDAQGRVEDARIAFGGMAGVPKRAAAAESTLIGQTPSRAALAVAANALDADFTPLTDWRASAAYRMRVARNLFERLALDLAGAPARLEPRVPASRRPAHG